MVSASCVSSGSHHVSTPLSMVGLLSLGEERNGIRGSLRGDSWTYRTLQEFTAILRNSLPPACRNAKANLMKKIMLALYQPWTQVFRSALPTWCHHFAAEKPAHSLPETPVAEYAPHAAKTTPKVAKDAFLHMGGAVYMWSARIRNECWVCCNCPDQSCVIRTMELRWIGQNTNQPQLDSMRCLVLDHLAHVRCSAKNVTTKRFVSKNDPNHYHYY